MRRMRFVALIGALFASVVLVACGSDSDSGSSSGDTVDVKLGTKEGTLPAEGMKIALFMAAISNEWQNQVVAGAEESAKEYGYEIETYNANFDPNEQLNQVQNALQQGSFDAALVLPADSNLMCDTFTKQVAAQGIPTVALAVPLCGNETEDGPGAYEDGTLAFVGSNNTLPFTQAWFEAAAERNPGEHTVGLVTGPALLGQTVTVKAVLEQFQPEHPEFDVKYIEETDFTTPDALAKTQNMLKAHPDIDLLMSVYGPDLTRGVVEGLDGKDIPIIDTGGSCYALEQIKKGVIQFTVPYFPYNIGAQGTSALKKAQDGEEVSEFIDDSEVGSAADPMVIDKDNMADFECQY